MIDITMTAVRRASILERTLESFRRNLFTDLDRYPCRLIINIDPVGNDPSFEECLRICHKYFPHVMSRCPAVPSFPKAFKWAWSSASQQFVFHLEDDWELLREVSLASMLDLMYKYKDLAILRLPYRQTTDTSKNWSTFYPWNGEFFECPEAERGTLGFCGHPSLIRIPFILAVAPLLSEVHNPEKQIKWRNVPIRKILYAYRYGVFAERDQPPAIKDIGSDYRNTSGWHKAGAKAYFTQWEKGGK